MDNKYKNIESQIGPSDDFFSPSDQVWNNIEKNIFPEKRNRKIMFLWFSLGFGLATFLFFGLHHEIQQMNDNIEEIIYHDVNIESNNFHIESNESQNFFGQVQKLDETTVKSELDIAKVSKPNTFDFNESKINLVDNTSNLLNNIYKDDNIKTSINSEKSQVNSNVSKLELEFTLPASTIDNADLNLPSLSKVIEIKSPVSIDRLQFGNLDASGKLDLSNINLINLPNRQKTNHYYIGASFSYFNNVSNNNLEKNISLSETVRTSTYKDFFEIGVRAVKSIGERWMVTTGIDYYSSSISTIYDLNIAYDLNSEYHNPTTSEYLNTFDHTLPTVGGTIETSLTLRRADDSNVAHNEGIVLDLTTDIRDKVIAIPITLRRYFKTNHAGFYINAGGQAGFVIDRKIQSSQPNSHHDIVKVKNGKLGLSQSFGDKVSINAVLGLGYSIPLDKINDGSFIDISVGLNQRISGTISNNYIQSEITFRKSL